MVDITRSHTAALQDLQWLILASSHGMLWQCLTFMKYHRCAETGPRLLQGQIPWKTVEIRVGENSWTVDVSPVPGSVTVGASTGTPSSSLTSYKLSQWNWVFLRCFDRYQDLKRWTGNCSGFCSQLYWGGFLNKRTDNRSCISTQGREVDLLHSAIFWHRQINHNTKTASPKGLLFRCCKFKTKKKKKK